MDEKVAFSFVHGEEKLSGVLRDVRKTAPTPVLLLTLYKNVVPKFVVILTGISGAVEGRLGSSTAVFTFP